MTDQTIVRLDDITMRYAGHTAVNALELTVPIGAVYGLLGPNGAGKTTTIRMIMNIIVPDAGQVELFGHVQSGHASYRIPTGGTRTIYEDEGC